jgi:hypothetical protein
VNGESLGYFCRDHADARDLRFIKSKSWEHPRNAARSAASEPCSLLGPLTTRCLNLAADVLCTPGPWGACRPWSATTRDHSHHANREPHEVSAAVGMLVGISDAMRRAALWRSVSRSSNRFGSPLVDRRRTTALCDGNNGAAACGGNYPHPHTLRRACIGNRPNTIVRRMRPSLSVRLTWRWPI